VRVGVSRLKKVVKMDAESKTNAEAMHKMSMVITRCRAVHAARPNSSSLLEAYWVLSTRSLKAAYPTSMAGSQRWKA
jgi:hypothetical protein